MVDDDELASLADLAARLGLASPPEARPLEADAAGALARTLPEAHREAALSALLDVAAADASVRFEERGYLYAVGAAFGLDERAVDARITERVRRR